MNKDARIKELENDCQRLAAELDYIGVADEELMYPDLYKSYLKRKVKNFKTGQNKTPEKESSSELKRFVMRDISFKICNNHEEIELMWINETQAASIFISNDSITVVASNGDKNIVKEFNKNTNLFDVRIWLEKFLNT